MLNYFEFFVPNTHLALAVALSEKKQVPFSMAKEMWNSCTRVFPNTRALEQQEWNNKETDEESKKRGVSMERSKAGTKEKRSPDGLNYHNQDTIIINIIG